MTDATANFALRDAEPRDRPILVRFIAALNAFEKALQPDRALGEAAAEEHLAYLESLVAQQDGFVLIAAGDAGPLGFLLAVVGEARAASSSPKPGAMAM